MEKKKPTWQVESSRGHQCAASLALFYVLLGWEGAAGPGCGRWKAGSPRNATALLAPLPASSGTGSGWGSHGRREAGEEGQGVHVKRTQERIFLGTERQGVWKETRSPAGANHGGQKRPWMLRFYTQVSQRETISSLKIIKWAEREGQPKQ